ncbi:hypothetical protein E2C01_013319 [Portunus trituberculatus]|uniref:Uncharacterized protein n=1 Tax=Portunus trituberculatus TaxID=210409 RepID=A0A5B7DGR9_PORTR|nr:hypothetical protein [Portunus trituberculatus]
MTKLQSGSLVTRRVIASCPTVNLHNADEFSVLQFPTLYSTSLRIKSGMQHLSTCTGTHIYPEF